MPFGTISVSSGDFSPRNPGVYSKDSVGFTDPSDEFRIRGSQGNTKNGNKSVSVTRYLQVDVTQGSDTVRKNCFVTLNITLPSGVSTTAAVLDTLVNDISQFVTEGTITRLMQGES